MNLRRFTDTGEWTTRRYLSLLGSVLIWIVVAIDAWYLWPTQLGGSTSMVVVSGSSMEPTYFSGDLVIARKTEPSVGDVIVYAPEALGGAQVVHRIIGGNATDGWQLQGDNNDYIDPFTPKASEVKGVVLVHYANFGRITVLLLNPMVWAFILLAAIVLLVWWSGDNCEDDREDDDDAADGEDADGPTQTSASTDDVDEGASLEPPGDGSAVSGPAPESLPEPAHAAVAEPHAATKSPFASAKRALGAGVMGLLALGLVVSPASASQLNVNTTASPVALSYAHCANLNLGATVTGTAAGANYTNVRVTGVTTACAGLPLQVKMYTSAGAVVTSATVSAVANAQTIAIPSYNGSQVARVVVTIKGWVYLATWTAPIAPFAQNCVVTRQNGTTSSCTVTVTDVGSVQYYGGLPYQEVNIAVTFPNGSQGVYWTADLNFGNVPGTTVAATNVSLVWEWISAPSGCAAFPQVSIRSDDYQFSGEFFVGNAPPWRPALCS